MSVRNLFGASASSPSDTQPLLPNKALSQWFTPIWAAEALVERYFDLGAGDLVLEPSCGSGSFLKALPAHVEAVGVEIDPLLAQRARADTGREIITGDFRTVQLTLKPTHIIGNPPYETAVLEPMLERCFNLLPHEGAAGFILPSYFVSHPARMLRYAKQVSVQVDQLPRSLFPRLSHPLVFAMFRKARMDRVLVGFALFEEADAVSRFDVEYRRILGNRQGGTWRDVARAAMRALGGEADLDQIYRVIEGRRPTTNKFWRDKLRQELQHREFRRVRTGRYALSKAA